MKLRYAGISFALSLLLTSTLCGQTTPQPKIDIKSADKIYENSKANSETNNFGLSSIAQIAVSVGDLERATTFYRDKLGLKYLFTANKMAFFEAGGIRLMLLARSAKPENDHGSSVIYYKVNDIQEAYKTLSDRGVKFDEVPEVAAKTAKFDLWLACLHDPENNQLCLMSEIVKK